MQNITEEWNEASASHDQSKQKLKKIEAEKSNAEDVRQQAMATFADTRKRKLKDHNFGSKRNYGSETMVVYLKNRAEQESYFKQQELELKKQELDVQQKRQVQQQQQQNLFQQQMMQQQQLILAMSKKFVDKE